MLRSPSFLVRIGVAPSLQGVFKKIRKDNELTQNPEVHFSVHLGYPKVLRVGTIEILLRIRKKTS